MRIYRLSDLTSEPNALRESGILLPNAATQERAKSRPDTAGAPTGPEVAALSHVPVLCIYGEGEADSICPGLPAGAQLAREQVGKGHHFSGEYATLADRILAFARAPHPVT